MEIRLITVSLLCRDSIQSYMNKKKHTHTWIYRYDQTQSERYKQKLLRQI